VKPVEEWIEPAEEALEVEAAAVATPVDDAMVVEALEPVLLIIEPVDIIDEDEAMEDDEAAAVAMAAIPLPIVE